jgi:uncharacterized protein (TIGR03437 family)
VQGTQFLFQIPAGTPVGAANVRVDFGGERSLPIAFTVNPPPPQIVAAATGANSPVDATHPAKAGDVLTLTVANLDQPGTSIDPARLLVSVAGLDIKVAAVMEQAGAFRVMLLLPANSPAGVQQATVSIDGRISDPFSLPVGN